MVTPPPAPAHRSRTRPVAVRRTIASRKRLTGHRTRMKPAASSGTELPLTCSVGDLFHKTDAAPGWDTFSCRGRNVWSLRTTPDAQE
jgi:hypothetical protein